ncbi:MAG: glycosyltransferase family 4 protein [Candidatus Omnitrophica bacterium]|nr:glycosyltransferase family 4 protein [Candidatus Omnitrophota bacterium]
MNLSKPKRVCFIVEADGWGGAEVHSLEFIKYLVSKGYYVEYVSCKNNYFNNEFTRIDPKHLKIIRTNLSIADKHRETPKLWAHFLRSLKSDTLIFQHLCHDHGRLIFFKACRKHFKKVYFIEHTFPPPMEPKTSKLYFNGMIRGIGLWWHMKRFQKKQVPKCANKIIAVSNDVRNKLIKFIFYPPDRTITVRNGVDWKRLSSIETTTDKLKRQYKLSPQAKAFGVLGRLSYEKGVDMAIEAFHIFATKNPDIDAYLFIVGQGIEEPILRKMVTDYKLEKKVIFTGFLTHPDKILPLFDVILSPSRREGLPLALLEAMSAGCLPVIFRIGGMPEVITHNDLGWIVEPEDIDGFAKAMEQAITLDHNIVNQRKQFILEHIRNNFDSNKSFEQIVETLSL